MWSRVCAHTHTHTHTDNTRTHDSVCRYPAASVAQLYEGWRGLQVGAERRLDRAGHLCTEADSDDWGSARKLQCSDKVVAALTAPKEPPKQPQSEAAAATRAPPRAQQQQQHQPPPPHVPSVVAPQTPPQGSAWGVQRSSGWAGAVAPDQPPAPASPYLSESGSDSAARLDHVLRDVQMASDQAQAAANAAAAMERSRHDTVPYNHGATSVRDHPLLCVFPRA
jgi:hypothetical protein